MITGAIARLHSSLTEVRRFIGLSEHKSAAVRHILRSGGAGLGPAAVWANEVASFTSGRTYDYACIVILIYGALERFVEDLADEYLSSLVARVPDFSGLPERLRNAHFELTLSHLARTQDARYVGVDARRLAASLASCLQASAPYEFVVDSMLFHTSNFRVAMVDDFLNRIGVPSASRRGVLTPGFAAYNARLPAPAEPPKDRPEAVWDLINDLVERRNQVSHGDVSNALGTSELSPYCDQVEAYCDSLARVVRDSLVTHLAPVCGVEHGNPIAVHNHNVVCIMSRGVVFSAGSILACQRPGQAEWYSLAVEEVQIDGEIVAETVAGSDIAIGLQTDGRCKDTYAVRSIAPPALRLRTANAPGSQQQELTQPESDIHMRVAARAYELYEARGRVAGFHVEDWLKAEREILQNDEK